MLGAAVTLAVVACGGSTDLSTTTAGPATTLTEAPAATTTTQAPASTTTGAPVDVITFVGADGVESEITDTSRIVSLNGDITEVLFALGLGDQVVAVDVTTTYPAETEDLPRVGFGQQLAAEGVLAFEPTLVIGDQLIAPAESIEQLRGAGVPVAIITTQTTLDGAAAKIGDVAAITGAVDVGETLALQVTDDIAAAMDLAAGATEQRRVAFVYTRGPEQLFLFGAGTVTQAMIEGANAIDAIADSGLSGFVPLTPEALVAAAPDVLIAPASGVGALGGPEGVLALPGVAQTPAGQAGPSALLVYDDGLFLNLGPRTGEALHQLVVDLYPELAS
jgi:iron complex transport system substrate-binding protein